MINNFSSLQINISAEDLVQKLLELSETENVCFLDSCGVNHLDSHLLIAGIKPLETLEITNSDSDKTLSIFNEKLSNAFASIFTISYDFGLKLENIKSRSKENSTFSEPDIYLATFDCIIAHDYNTGNTFLTGNQKRIHEINNLLSQPKKANDFSDNRVKTNSSVKSNFSKSEYISKIIKIQEYLLEGETYQTNLTQQFRVKLSSELTPQLIFTNLRKNHPAPFASFFKRKNDYVISISPERFVKVQIPNSNLNSLIIKTSPIKGTRSRGTTFEEDTKFKNELLTSDKDRAENTMIVDLLRNDIGRICEFGSVIVEKLCDLEEHPSLFHLVSTISGKLRKSANYSDIIKATFPCGSITGCPKIRTMQIIDELETVNRGLSMGAIGCSISDTYFDNDSQNKKAIQFPVFDTSVAIRTIVINDQEAIFNVGGGIVIDSNPEDEYQESLLKAKALFQAIGIE